MAHDEKVSEALKHRVLREIFEWKEQGLVAAVEKGHDGAALFLLRRGADPDARNGADEPVPHLAAGRGHEAITEALAGGGRRSRPATRGGERRSSARAAALNLP